MGSSSVARTPSTRRNHVNQVPDSGTVGAIVLKFVEPDCAAGGGETSLP